MSTPAFIGRVLQVHLWFGHGIGTHLHTQDVLVAKLQTFSPFSVRKVDPKQAGNVSTFNQIYTKALSFSGRRCLFTVACQGALFASAFLKQLKPPTLTTNQKHGPGECCSFNTSPACSPSVCSTTAEIAATSETCISWWRGDRGCARREAQHAGPTPSSRRHGRRFPMVWTVDEFLFLQ